MCASLSGYFSEGGIGMCASSSGQVGRGWRENMEANTEDEQLMALLLGHQLSAQKIEKILLSR